MDEAGRELQPGEVGEVVTRGDHVMPGYWNAEGRGDLSKSVRDGWLHTGDLGRLDATERLWLVDRKGDMIISGGYNIYPREVEDVVAEVPGVHEVAVVGVDDRDWGQRVVAVITVTTGCRRRRPARYSSTAARGWRRTRSRRTSASSSPSRTTRPGRSTRSSCANSSTRRPRPHGATEARLRPRGCGAAGGVPVHTRHHDRTRPVDHGSVRRLRHATGIQPEVSPAARRGRHRLLRRPRPAHADGPRLRRPAGRRRGRARWCRDRLARRHREY